jgi:hypothetical protein
MTTMLIPVGIAYAEASGLPGINGLYATIVPLLAYALFGPSRILVLGPDSALAAVILTVVLPLSVGQPDRAVALAGMMAMISGLLCIATGLARLGFITDLLSKPIRYGYMNGIALTVLLSQIPRLFGFSVKAGGPLRQTLGHSQGGRRRKHQAGDARDRTRHACIDPAFETLAACTWNSARCRDGHGCGGDIQVVQYRRDGTRAVTKRLTFAKAALCPHRRLDTTSDG